MSNFNLLAIVKRKRGRFFQSNDGERRAKTGGTKILLASSYVETWTDHGRATAAIRRYYY